MKSWESLSHFACYTEAALAQTGLLSFDIRHCLCVLLVVRLKHSGQYTAMSLKCLSQLGFESHTFFPPRHATFTEKHIVSLMT